MYYMGQSMYYMSSVSIPTTNPCITWVGHVLHGLITHVIHVLGMYYMSCSCITWVSIPIMDPHNAWVPCITWDTSGVTWRCISYMRLQLVSHDFCNLCWCSLIMVLQSTPAPTCKALSSADYQDAIPTTYSSCCRWWWCLCCRCKTRCPQSRADNPLLSQQHFSVAM